MSGFTEKSDRRVLPVWRNSSVAAASIEVQPLKRSRPRLTQPKDGAVEERIREFDMQPTLGTAADALNTAALSDQLIAVERIAKYVKSLADRSPPPLVRLADRVLSLGVDPVEAADSPDSFLLAGHAIRELRRLLLINPRNPILLVDLAREYATIGKVYAAERAITTALSLAKQDRWVSRMASRFFVHAGEKDRAHKLVAIHADIKNDPWLIAAELAIAQAAGKSPKYWSRAKTLLESSLPPEHLSELACAVATLELASGNNKRARKNFRQALNSPTENALAQVTWAERHLKSSLASDSTVAEAERAFEARFWAAYHRSDMAEARSSAEQWLTDEPFSKRPASMLSYIASVLDDHEAVRRASLWGLRANPDDDTLQLNLIFAELSLAFRNIESDAVSLVTQLDGIQKRLLAHIREGRAAAHAWANAGLMLYRLGDTESGKTAYARAVSTATEGNVPLTAAAARIFHAREAILAKSSSATELIDEARACLQKVKSPGLTFYLAKLEVLQQHPERQSEILNPSFQLSTTEPKRPKLALPRFELTDKGATIWLPKGHIKR